MPQVLLHKVNNTKLSLTFESGVHVLGRGAKLMCESKIVSRYHGVLKIDNAGVLLRSIHNNPCYYLPNQGNRISVVTFGNSIKIKNGDQIALSLDHGWFKVQITPENGANLNVPEIVGNSDLVTDRKRGNDCSETIVNNKKIKIEPIEDDIDITVPQTAETSALVTSEIVQLAEGCSGVSVNLQTTASAVTNTLLRAVTPNRQIEETSGVAEHLQTELVPPEILQQNLRAEADSRVAEHLQNELVPPEIQQQNLRAEADSEVAENLPDTVATPEIVRQVQIKTEPIVEQNETASENTGNVLIKAEIKDEPADKPSTSGTNNRAWRDRCWYGKSCYRKNGGHRATFRHFGDSDYDSDDNDSRPICCYGVGCYRRNVEHRQKYRHPGQDRLPRRPPQAQQQPQNAPKRRKAKAKKQATPDYGDLNSDEESDPYLTGGSSDDYDPVDTDTESDCENEDSTQDIAREARKLVKYARQLNKK